MQTKIKLILKELIWVCMLLRLSELKWVGGAGGLVVVGTVGEGGGGTFFTALSVYVYVCELPMS